MVSFTLLIHVLMKTITDNTMVSFDKEHCGVIVFNSNNNSNSNSNSNTSNINNTAVQ